MARKDVNIVTSLVGKGLEREYNLLKDLLTGHECYTNVYHYTNFAGSNFVRADINIFLEVCMPNVFSLSRENWLFPNCEWWHGLNDQFVSRFTKVCCKTRDCERLWKSKLAGDRPERVVYTGFEARDLYRPDVPRENRFLHVAGESEFKNTEAVIAAWRGSNWSFKPLPLTVVTRQKKYQDLCEEARKALNKDADLITCISRASEDELVQLMNSHRFHILPSSYEGFGHALNEGIGCGALVITTAAPPMNEFPGVQGDWTVPVASHTTRSLAQLNHVNPNGVITGVCKALAVAENIAELERRSQQARAAFLSSRDSFRKKFLELVGVD